MADTVRRAEYHYVEVPDQPGEGSHVLSALKEDRLRAELVDPVLTSSDSDVDPEMAAVLRSLGYVE